VSASDSDARSLGRAVWERHAAAALIGGARGAHRRGLGMAVHARHAGFAEAMLRRVAGRDGAQAGGWSGGFVIARRVAAGSPPQPGEEPEHAPPLARAVFERVANADDVHEPDRALPAADSYGPVAEAVQDVQRTVAASPLNAESTPGITTKLARRANIAAQGLQGRAALQPSRAVSTQDASVVARAAVMRTDVAPVAGFVAEDAHGFIGSELHCEFHDAHDAGNRDAPDVVAPAVSPAPTLSRTPIAAALDVARREAGLSSEGHDRMPIALHPSGSVGAQGGSHGAAGVTLMDGVRARHIDRQYGQGLSDKQDRGLAEKVSIEPGIPMYEGLSRASAVPYDGQQQRGSSLLPGSGMSMRSVDVSMDRAPGSIGQSASARHIAASLMGAHVAHPDSNAVYATAPAVSLPTQRPLTMAMRSVFGMTSSPDQERAETEVSLQSAWRGMRSRVSATPDRVATATHDEPHPAAFADSIARTASASDLETPHGSHDSTVARETYSFDRTPYARVMRAGGGASTTPADPDDTYRPMPDARIARAGDSIDDSRTGTRGSLPVADMPIRRTGSTLPGEQAAPSRDIESMPASTPLSARSIPSAGPEARMLQLARGTTASPVADAARHADQHAEQHAGRTSHSQAETQRDDARFPTPGFAARGLEAPSVATTLPVAVQRPTHSETARHALPQQTQGATETRTLSLTAASRVRIVDRAADAAIPAGRSRSAWPQAPSRVATFPDPAPHSLPLKFSENAPHREAGGAPAPAPAPATGAEPVDRLADEYGVVPLALQAEPAGAVPATEPEPSPPNTTPAAHAGSPQKTRDAAELADEAWRIIMDRLAVERERRGFASWP